MNHQDPLLPHDDDGQTPFRWRDLVTLLLFGLLALLLAGVVTWVGGMR